VSVAMRLLEQQLVSVVLSFLLADVIQYLNLVPAVLRLRLVSRPVVPEPYACVPARPRPGLLLLCIICLLPHVVKPK
jgi:hypothetical protein